MTSQAPKVGKDKDRTRAPLCLPQQRAPSPAAPAQTQPAIGVRSRAPSCKAPATAEPQMARPPGKRYSTCTSEFECSATGGVKMPRLAPRTLRIRSRTRCQPACGPRGDAGPEGNPEPGAG